MLEKIQKYETELWTVLCVLFFNIIAHGYRFVNLMFNGDSLLIYQTDQNWKYSIGRIFQPFYWKLRGDLVAPMLIATLAVFYFTAALVLIVRMFKLQNKLHIALLCALLAVNPLPRPLPSPLIFMRAILTCWHCSAPPSA